MVTSHPQPREGWNKRRCAHQEASILYAYTIQGPKPGTGVTHFQAGSSCINSGN